MSTSVRIAPRNFEGVAAALANATADRHTVRIRGGGTKLGWGRVTEAADVELSTAGLDRIVEHNAGDLTAVIEAGVPLVEAQRTFAAAGQMLALDPPLGRDAAATVGGVVATGDAGPLRHRFGAPRDLILGATVALSDGQIAHSGGKVIKNVAGYDLAKLFAGAFGTLGLILSVSVRLHPRPPGSTTALGASSDAGAIAAAAVAMAAAPFEFDALDVAWRGGRGGILARCSGPEHARRARRAARALDDLGLERVEVSDQDAPLWERQRAGQRSAQRALVRITAKPSGLAQVLSASDACGGTVVGRAGLGVSYLELDPDALPRLHDHMHSGATATLLDAPVQLRAESDPWGPLESPAQALMRNVKARFDPARTCNPGLFVGGI
jgi:glycolate oxidase FAD binding subunit